MSFLLYIYKTSIIATNVYSFYTFVQHVSPYIQQYKDKIPYDDLESVYNKIIYILAKKSVDTSLDTFFDISTSQIIISKL